jgi:hypothetical protein
MIIRTDSKSDVKSSANAGASASAGAGAGSGAGGGGASADPFGALSPKEAAQLRAAMAQMEAEERYGQCRAVQTWFVCGLPSYSGDVCVCVCVSCSAARDAKRRAEAEADEALARKLAQEMQAADAAQRAKAREAEQAASEKLLQEV